MIFLLAKYIYSYWQNSFRPFSSKICVPSFLAVYSITLHAILYSQVYLNAKSWYILGEDILKGN